MAIFNIFKTFWHKKEIKQDKKSDLSGIHDFKYKAHIEVRFQDFDKMGHVNNAVYLTYMEIARTKYWTHAIGWDWEKTGVIIGRASIDYIQPVFMDDQLSMYIRTSRIGNSSFDLDYILVKNIDSKNSICSRGKTVCIAYDYHKKQSVPIPIIERNKMIAFEQLE